MTIEKIKKAINDEIGNKVKIVSKSSRNRVEKYSGIITEVYNYIFIIKLSTNENKSFNYSDVLTKNIEIYFNK